MKSQKQGLMLWLQRHKKKGKLTPVKGSMKPMKGPMKSGDTFQHERAESKTKELKEPAGT